MKKQILYGLKCAKKLQTYDYFAEIQEIANEINIRNKSSKEKTEVN